MDHLEQQVARLREPACRLVISTGLVWTPPFLPAVIARFQQVAPHVEVQRAIQARFMMSLRPRRRGQT